MTDRIKAASCIGLFHTEGLWDLLQTPAAKNSAIKRSLQYYAATIDQVEVHKVTNHHFHNVNGNLYAGTDSTPDCAERCH